MMMVKINAFFSIFTDVSLFRTFFLKEVVNSDHHFFLMMKYRHIEIYLDIIFKSSLSVPVGQIQSNLMA